MKRAPLHVEALRAIIDVATSNRRWQSVSQIATESGFTHSALFNALAGERQLSPKTRKALCSTLGISEDAFTLPVVAIDQKQLERVLIGRFEDLSVDVSNLGRDLRQLGG